MMKKDNNSLRPTCSYELKRESADIISFVISSCSTVNIVIWIYFQNAWTLWFFKNDKTKQWEENQREIITFTTVSFLQMIILIILIFLLPGGGFLGSVQPHRACQ